MFKKLLAGVVTASMLLCAAMAPVYAEDPLQMTGGDTAETIIDSDHDAFDNAIRAFDVEADDEYIYVTENANGLRIYDRETHALVNEGYDLKDTLKKARYLGLNGSYAYVVNEGEDKIQVVNVSNPAQPVLEPNVNARMAIKTIYLDKQSSLLYVGIAAGGTETAGLRIYDVSGENAGKPSLKTKLVIPADTENGCEGYGVPKAVRPVGDYLYILLDSKSGRGLCVYELDAVLAGTATVNEAELLDFVCTSPIYEGRDDGQGGTTTTANIMESIDLEVYEDYAFITIIHNYNPDRVGMIVVDTADKSNLKIHKQYAGAEDAWGLTGATFLEGNILYTGSYNKITPVRVSAYDVNLLADPDTQTLAEAELARVECTNAEYNKGWGYGFTGITKVGDTLYAANCQSGLRIITVIGGPEPEPEPDPVLAVTAGGFTAGGEAASSLTDGEITGSLTISNGTGAAKTPVVCWALYDADGRLAEIKLVNDVTINTGETHEYADTLTVDTQKHSLYKLFAFESLASLTPLVSDVGALALQ